MWQRLTVCGRSRCFPSFPSGSPTQRKSDPQRRDNVPYSTDSDHFYSVSQEVDEKRFVTARGWEDLSAVLKSYEILHFPVDGSTDRTIFAGRKDGGGIQLVLQDLRKNMDRITGVEEILTGAFSGKNHGTKQQMAANGSAEERSVLLSLFHAALQKEASACQEAGAHGKGAFQSACASFTGLCRQKKMRHTHPGCGRKSRDLHCAKSRDC